jgi:hypothetical protein
VVVVLTVLGLEVVIRLAVFTSIFPRPVRDLVGAPALYAHPHEDAYWTLLNLVTDRRTLGAFYHPELGATTPRSARNPLGVAGKPRPLPDPARAAEIVLFYGDSYLTTPFFGVAQRIPQKLEAALGVPVWNLGMWNYGLDQIVMRFESTHRHFATPSVLVGVLTDDIDRCVLSVREGQKPRFVLDGDGQLVLTNVPIEEDQGAYFRRHPPQIRSYVARLVGRALGGSALGKAWGLLQPDERRVEKTALAAALIDRAIEVARRRQMPLAFVVFYTRGELEDGGWRPDLLRETLESRGVPFVDTAVPLRRALDTGQASIEELFDAKTQHHTAVANDLIVAEIAHRWPELFPARP